MSGEWRKEKLGNLCSIRTGRKDVREGNPNGTYPFFTCARNHTYSDEYSFDTEAILIAGNGDVGHASYYKGKFEAYQRTYVLADFKGVDPQYLFFILDGLLKEALFDQKLGNTMPYIKKGMLTGFPIALPRLPEQKRLAAILDEAFAGIDTAIANTEKNLANSRELFESYLNAVFSQQSEGWVERSLSDISHIDSSLVDPRKAEFADLPHVGAGNITSKTGKLVNIQTASEEGLKSGKFLFDESMVLYSKIRPYLEKIARPSFSGLCSADVYPLSPKDEYLCRDFLYYMLLSRDFTDYAIAGSARAGMPKVNRDHLFRYCTALPNVGEQKRLVDSLNDVASESQRLESIYQQKLTALTELKKSLLQKAFSGELTGDNVVPITSVKKPSASVKADSPAFAAHIMAVAYHWHEAKGKNRTFGHVKAQKTLHLVEALAQVDLGRVPVKDAAGPNDFAHMRTAEKWAKDNDFYEFVLRPEGQRGYDFVKGKRYSEWLPQSLEAVEPYKSTLDRVVGLLMPLDTQKAELVATAYAAWNNLLLDGHKPTEANIIHEARENWHRDKHQYTNQQFREAIDRLRSQGMGPTGTGKRVIGQESFEL